MVYRILFRLLFVSLFCGTFLPSVWAARLSGSLNTQELGTLNEQMGSATVTPSYLTGFDGLNLFDFKVGASFSLSSWGDINNFGDKNGTYSNLFPFGLFYGSFKVHQALQIEISFFPPLYPGLIGYGATVAYEWLNLNSHHSKFLFKVGYNRSEVLQDIRFGIFSLLLQLDKKLQQMDMTFSFFMGINSVENSFVASSSADTSFNTSTSLSPVSKVPRVGVQVGFGNYLPVQIQFNVQPKNLNLSALMYFNF